MTLSRELKNYYKQISPESRFVICKAQSTCSYQWLDAPALRDQFSLSADQTGYVDEGIDRIRDHAFRKPVEQTLDLNQGITV